MAKKALLIGINYYDTPENKLNGCINDTVNLRNMLIDAYGYDSNNIAVLRDDAADSINKPTRANILSNLSAIIAQSRSLQEIWILYSGHGSQIRDMNGDEKDGLDEIIVPSDYSKTGVISDDMIFNIVKQSKCPTILIFDSCSSGTICDLMWNFNATSSTQVAAVKTANNVIQNPNIFCFSGCRDEQTSADIYNLFTQQSCGALTNAIAECMRLNRHDVDVKKLYLNIVSYIKQQGLQQIPQISSSSQFPLYKIVKTVSTPSVTASAAVLKQTMKIVLRNL
jgi:hypothetical protein